MMFLKCGCGCVVLVVNATPVEKKDWTVRMIDYCGETDGIALGPEESLRRIMAPNIANSRFLSHEEYTPYLDRISVMMRQSYAFERLQQALRPFVASE